jgi:IS30 family transposase
VTSQELTYGEREEISRGLAEHLSHQGIASRMGRHQSTISREVKKNGGDARYRAADAHRHAGEMRRRPQTFKIESSRRRHDAVAEKLRDDYISRAGFRAAAERIPGRPGDRARVPLLIT